MAAPTYVNGATGTTSATLGTTQANDIIIASFKSGFGAPTAPGGTYSGGAWTQVGQVSTGSANHVLTVFWSRATGNHSGQTVTDGGVGTNAEVVAVYRGCPTSSSPIDTNISTDHKDATSGTTVTPAAFNTTAADDLVVLAVGNDFNTSTWSTETKGGSAMTERSDANGAAIADLSQASTGTTGAFSATTTSSFLNRLGIAFGLLAATFTSVNVTDTATESEVSSEAVTQATTDSATDTDVSSERARIGTRRNLAPNPSLEANLTGVGNGASGAGFTLVSQTRSNVWSKYGTWSVYYKSTRSAGGVAGDAYQNLNQGGVNGIKVKPSEQYYFSAWVNVLSTPGVGQGPKLYVNYYDSGGNLLFSGGNVISPAAPIGVSQIGGPTTVPANAAFATLYIGHAWGWNMGANTTSEYYTDGILFEPGSDLLPYFDGGTAEGGETTAWEGTTNNSASYTTGPGRDTATFSEAPGQIIRPAVDDAAFQTEVSDEAVQFALTDAAALAEAKGMSIDLPRSEAYSLSESSALVQLAVTIISPRLVHYRNVPLVVAVSGGPTTQLKFWSPDVDTSADPAVQTTEGASAWVSASALQVVTLAAPDRDCTIWVRAQSSTSLLDAVSFPVYLDEAFAMTLVYPQGPVPFTADSPLWSRRGQTFDGSTVVATLSDAEIAVSEFGYLSAGVTSPRFSYSP